MKCIKKNKKWLLLSLSLAISLAIPSIKLTSTEIYDLCYKKELLRDGKLLFIRYKNPTLDPVFKTYEIYLFDPITGKVTFLQKPGEKLYITPAVSADRTTVTYHALIEGNDFLITRNLATGVSTRLRFDTGGYFLKLTINYDNDTIAATLKRGEGREAIYVISNSRGTIKRIQNGSSFKQIGFLRNGNIFYVDESDTKTTLGVVRQDGKSRAPVAFEPGYVEMTPGGEAILYSKENELFLYKAAKNESIRISQGFSSGLPLPATAPDGLSCAVFEENSILIVNIPSGDVMYFLTFDTAGSRGFLTDFTFYVEKLNRIYYILHKKPDQHLYEAYRDEEPIKIIGISPDDRFIVFQKKKKNEMIIYNRNDGTRFVKEFPFEVEDILIAPPVKLDSSPLLIYISAISPGPKKDSLLRELYLYNYTNRSLTAISTAEDTDLKPYLRIQ